MLPILVRRLALLDEGRHALGAILQREGRVKQIALDIQSVGQRGLEGAIDRLLCHRGRGLRHRGDFFRSRQRLLHQLVRRHHAADETRAFGFGCIHHSPGEAQIHRLGFSDGARQALGTADAGNGAERDLGLPEFRVVGGNDDVAHHRELAAAAERITRDGRDGRLAAAGDPVAADRGEIAGKHVDEAFRLHFLDVGARREGLFAAGHQNATDLLVGLEIVDRRRDFAKHAERQRVEHFRAIELDDADGALALDNDVLERRHDPTPLSIFADNLPAGGVGFKWAARSAQGVLVGGSGSAAQAMNIRAAEAIVSNAPNTTKIFPTNEVSSQTELSLAATMIGATRRIGSSAAAVRVRNASLFAARSTSLSWLGPTTWFSALARVIRPWAFASPEPSTCGARQITTPAMAINARRPRLVAMCNLPGLRLTGQKRDPRACPHRGEKGESSRTGGRKQGNASGWCTFASLPAVRRDRCQPRRSML